MSDDHFLSRWSRLKTASKAPAAPAEPTPEAREASPQPAAAPPAATPPAETAPQPLPPVESLTPESDFAGFMREGIDPSLRRQAIRRASPYAGNTVAVMARTSTTFAAAHEADADPSHQTGAST